MKKNCIRNTRSNALLMTWVVRKEMSQIYSISGFTERWRKKLHDASFAKILTNMTCVRYGCQQLACFGSKLLNQTLKASGIF